MTNGTGNAHFGVNTDGIFYKSPNKPDFRIELSADGHNRATIDGSKAVGGADKKG
ncbi:MAG: hypothetical protein M3017_16000 [Actinomycetota bacterium]|nr:hypothetical protein [Actinomycetota bacterium]